MFFNTFIITIATLALVNASPLQKRYGNETRSELSSLTSSHSVGLETMPSILPSNTTTMVNSITSSNVFQITTTAVESITLTYTLGPEGSSSIVTTVVENTSTITMTSTVYVTMTRTSEPSGIAEVTAPETGNMPSVTSNISAIESSNHLTMTVPGEEATATAFGNEPTNIQFGDEPSDTELGDGQSGTVESNTSGFSDDPTPTLSDNEPIAESSENSTATTFDNEPTVTITDYLTTTETITMEAIPTAVNGLDFSNLGGNAFFGSSLHLPPWVSSLLGGPTGACIITTVTATVVEQSTITVTLTGTDNFPIAPTATPSYGFGNGTDPITGFPTASSGFFTLYKQSTPTKL